MSSEHAVLNVLNTLGASNSTDLPTRISELLGTLGVWEVAHRLRLLPPERAREVSEFLEYLRAHYPAAADRIHILLTATKGEDKELLQREFGEE